MENLTAQEMRSMDSGRLMGRLMECEAEESGLGKFMQAKLTERAEAQGKLDKIKAELTILRYKVGSLREEKKTLKTLLRAEKE